MFMSRCKLFIQFVIYFWIFSEAKKLNLFSALHCHVNYNFPRLGIVIFNIPIFIDLF